MKCSECKKYLKVFFYLIGGKKFCKVCALEFSSEIKDFKIEIKDKGGKNGERN